jgi:thiamine biosynthesis lipoprotein ApbE
MGAKSITVFGRVCQTIIGVFLVVQVLGCSGEEQKRQLAELQKKSDERVAQVEQRYKEQVADLEKRISSLKDDVADASAKAKSEAEDAIAKANASVEEAEKAAETALGKVRDAYRREAQTKYANLNVDLKKVTSKAPKIPAKSKAAYDKAIQKVLSLQKDIAKDIAAYKDVTLDTLSKTKAKVDVDLAKYKLAINAAKAKLPK